MNAYETFDPLSNVASLIDHTLLRPEAAESDIALLCAQALRHRFFSVCVNPCWVSVSKSLLAGSEVAVGTVIGFPLGANKTRTKLFEAELALEEGAGELDVVQNLGALRSGDLQLVRSELAELTGLAHSRNALLKVILETSLLTDQQKETACRLAIEAKVDFVKTSTGFSGSGATVGDVTLMRRTVGSALGVKASGGVRSLTAVREMVAAGANRIGTSSGVQILAELEQEAAPLPGVSASSGVLGGGY